MSAPKLLSALNDLATELQILGSRRLPKIVFTDVTDWIEIAPHLSLGGDTDNDMLAGFWFQLERPAVNDSNRFVDQEIGGPLEFGTAGTRNRAGRVPDRGGMFG